MKARKRAAIITLLSTLLLLVPTVQCIDCISACSASTSQVEDVVCNDPFGDGTPGGYNSGLVTCPSYSNECYTLTYVLPSSDRDVNVSLWGVTEAQYDYLYTLLDVEERGYFTLLEFGQALPRIKNRRGPAAQQKIARDIESVIVENCTTAIGCFSAWDVDLSGSVTKAELRAGLASIGVQYGANWQVQTMVGNPSVYTNANLSGEVVTLRGCGGMLSCPGFSPVDVGADTTYTPPQNALFPPPFPSLSGLTCCEGDHCNPLCGSSPTINITATVAFTVDGVSLPAEGRTNVTAGEVEEGQSPALQPGLDIMIGETLTLEVISGDVDGDEFNLTFVGLASKCGGVEEVEHSNFDGKLFKWRPRWTDGGRTGGLCFRADDGTCAGPTIRCFPITVTTCKARITQEVIDEDGVVMLASVAKILGSHWLSLWTFNMDLPNPDVILTHNQTIDLGLTYRRRTVDTFDSVLSMFGLTESSFLATNHHVCNGKLEDDLCISSNVCNALGREITVGFEWETWTYN
uniref:EF-hand domain-containing protein n=2 Tax=Palpitomonas bilix TaxID=652834 RepID=A0A7S3DFP4_9EUKA|mmetsp:Transcript_35307/g.91780  ORF Transcript_35307/g.91780 Transcript_35307/m.91780 type:complete len:518 (+) Transcript_35307:348-1901(+)